MRIMWRPVHDFVCYCDDGDEVWMIYIHLGDKMVVWIVVIPWNDDNVRIVIIILLS